MSSAVRRAILRSIERLLARHERLVLAVSGGADSMTLLDAVWRIRAERHVVVTASFDHGSGSHARDAVAFVAAESARRGLAVRTDAAPSGLRGEAEWRQARWQFLRSVARAENAAVVTAHTRDDQIETIVMRLLRDTGARGLAALRAPSVIARPLLDHSRREVLQYLKAFGVAYLKDPTNDSRQYLRNRVRLDLLPALRAARPELEGELLALAERAARMRHELDGAASRFVLPASPLGECEVDIRALAGFSQRELRLLWQSIAASAGAILDWRATERVAMFCVNGRSGQRIQISGGGEVVRTRSSLLLRRSPARGPATAAPVPGTGNFRFGVWHFRRLTGTTIREASVDPWIAVLPPRANLEVRAWEPGDRLAASGLQSGRRVKRCFADAGIVGALRSGWPVVLLEGSVVWIPGVRRAPAALSPIQKSSILLRCDRDSF